MRYNDQEIQIDDPVVADKTISIRQAGILRQHSAVGNAGCAVVDFAGTLQAVDGSTIRKVTVNDIPGVTYSDETRLVYGSTRPAAVVSPPSKLALASEADQAQFAKLKDDALHMQAEAGRIMESFTKGQTSMENARQSQAAVLRSMETANTFGLRILQQDQINGMVAVVSSGASSAASSAEIVAATGTYQQKYEKWRELRKEALRIKQQADDLMATRGATYQAIMDIRARSGVFESNAQAMAQEMLDDTLETGMVIEAPVTVQDPFITNVIELVTPMPPAARTTLLTYLFTGQTWTSAAAPAQAAPACATCGIPVGTSEVLCRAHAMEKVMDALVGVRTAREGLPAGGPL